MVEAIEEGVVEVTEESFEAVEVAVVDMAMAVDVAVEIRTEDLSEAAVVVAVASVYVDEAVVGCPDAEVAEVTEFESVPLRPYLV